MFNIKYLVMYRVQMHAGAVSWLEYRSCVCTGDNPLADSRGLSTVQTHKPYSNYRLFSSFTKLTWYCNIVWSNTSNYNINLYKGVLAHEYNGLQESLEQLDILSFDQYGKY